MAVFSVKKRIFRAQRLRYRQRLRELGDNSDDLEDEKRQKKEAAQLAQSIIIEDQKRLMSGSQIASQGAVPGGRGLDFAASHRSLALAAAAAGNMNVSTMSLPKAERSFDIRFEKLGLTLPTGVDIIKVCRFVFVKVFLSLQNCKERTLTYFSLPAPCHYIER